MKPARLGSSVGITKAHDDDELRAGVALAFEHDEKVLVERFVPGVEVEVGVLGNLTPIASLPGEIVVTHNEWYDFEAKYDEGEMDLVVPARITEAQIERAQELAVRAFVATDCEGMARADLFVRDDGEVLVNELNTIPGFTSTSVYARLFEASGHPVRRAARSASPTSRSSASSGAGSCAIDDSRSGPWLLSDAATRRSRRTHAAFDGAARPHARRGGDRRLRPAAAEVVVPAPPSIALAATSCTARTSREIDEFRTRRELRRAQHQPCRGGLRDVTTPSGRSTSRSSTARSRRATSTGASTSTVHRATSSRSAAIPVTPASWTTRDDLCAAARDVRATPASRELDQRSCRCARGRG